MGLFDQPPFDMRLFATPPTPEEGFMQVVKKIDPGAVLYREHDHMNWAERFTLRWKTLGVRFGHTQVVSDDVMINSRLDDYSQFIMDYLIEAMISAIMEAYVEFWHLDYEGPLSLQEFTNMTSLEEFYYLDSNGDYIPGRNDYARVCRLQQRDAGRFGTPERLTREDL
jgi:hypothetical protein